MQSATVAGTRRAVSAWPRVLFVWCLLVVPLAVWAGSISNALPNADGTYNAWDPGPNAYTKVNQGVGCVAPDTTFWEHNIGANVPAIRQSATVDISAIPNGARILQVEVTVCYGLPTSGVGLGTFKTFVAIDLNPPVDALATITVPPVPAPPSLPPPDPQSTSQTMQLAGGVIKTSTSSLQIGVVKEDQGSATTRRAVRIYTLAAASVTYEDPATLKLVKLATSASPNIPSTTFGFQIAPDPVDPPAAFDLVVDGLNPQAEHTTSLEPGTPYQVTEGPYPLSWNLVDITCVGAVTWGANIAGRSVTITPADQESITCTFTNRYTAPAAASVIPALGGPGLVGLGIGLAALAAFARRRQRRA